MKGTRKNTGRRSSASASPVYTNATNFEESEESAVPLKLVAASSPISSPSTISTTPPPPLSPAYGAISPAKENRALKIRSITSLYRERIQPSNTTVCSLPDFDPDDSSVRLVVVKNAPYIAELESSFDLRQATVSAQLVYDSAELKPVDYIRASPLDTTAFVDKRGSGTNVKIEMRLRVLTSQHEDSAFRVRFAAVNSESVYQCLSPAIRVISKADTQHKERRPTQGKCGGRRRTRTAQGELIEEDNSSALGKRRRGTIPSQAAERSSKRCCVEVKPLDCITVVPPPHICSPSLVVATPLPSQVPAQGLQISNNQEQQQDAVNQVESQMCKGTHPAHNTTNTAVPTPILCTVERKLEVDESCGVAASQHQIQENLQVESGSEFVKSSLEESLEALLQAYLLTPPAERQERINRLFSCQGKVGVPTWHALLDNLASAVLLPCYTAVPYYESGLVASQQPICARPPSLPTPNPLVSTFSYETSPLETPPAMSPSPTHPPLSPSSTPASSPSITSPSGIDDLFTNDDVQDNTCTSLDSTSTWAEDPFRAPCQSPVPSYSELFVDPGYFTNTGDIDSNILRLL